MNGCRKGVYFNLYSHVRWLITTLGLMQHAHYALVLKIPVFPSAVAHFMLSRSLQNRKAEV